MNARRVMLGLLAVLLPACAGTQTARLHGTVVSATPAFNFALVDQRDQPLTLQSMRGDEIILFFGYTHCPDECPITMAHLATVYHSLALGDRKRVRVLFVTVDPRRDSPAELGRYLRAFDVDFLGLTGSASALASTYKAYAVDRRLVEEARNGKEDVAHSSTIYLIDPRGRLRVLFDWDANLVDIEHDVKELLAPEPSAA